MSSNLFAPVDPKKERLLALIAPMLLIAANPGVNTSHKKGVSVSFKSLTECVLLVI